MKHSLRSFLTSVLLATSLLAFGCGGGGGGGGVLGPDTGFEGITGPLDFAQLTTPSGYTSAGWPVPAGSDKFAVPAFSNDTVGILLANFTSASQTIVISADQSLSFASSRSEVAPEIRAFARSRVSDFHSGLRRLERENSGGGSAGVSASVRASQRFAFPGDTHDFKVYTEGNYMTVTGNLYASQDLPDKTGKLKFYYDKDLPLSDSLTEYYDSIISGWNSIYTTMHSRFGKELQANETQTGATLGSDIYVLISRRLSEIDPDLAGFFYSGDLYPPDRLTNGISNQLKIFYLNLRESENALTLDIMKSTMAHEFQHMIFYSNRIRNGVTSDDAWLNETLSAFAESACGFSVANKNNQSKAIQMQAYFDAMNRVPLVQDDGWGSNAQYGQVALFGEWFAEEYEPSVSALKKLYASKKTGMAAVEEVTGKSFETIFSQWMLAMYLDIPESIYGFDTLDWKEYEFPGLAPITLTGPVQAKKGNLIADAYLRSSSITLMPMSCYMIRFAGGGNSEALDFTMQPGSEVTVFELGK